MGFKQNVMMHITCKKKFGNPELSSYLSLNSIMEDETPLYGIDKGIINAEKEQSNFTYGIAL